MHSLSLRAVSSLVVPIVSLAFALPAAAQRGGAKASDVSAPVSDLRYEVSFTGATAAERVLKVTTRFSVSGRDPVLLSLPAWTPGAYELSFFARNVLNFAATGDGKALTWDKLDYDTWRIATGGAKAVTVTFDYRADSLDNAMAWSRDNFAFFNGTNLFLYPEGRDASFGASVTVTTEANWQVTTGMASTGARTYSARNYHDLVDMPFFVGAFDVDSQLVRDKWVRLATYPAGGLSGDARRTFWEQVQRAFPPMIDVIGDVPYDTYSILAVFDSSSMGGSALEHANSHVGIYTPFIIGNTALPSITAHEIFHLWNVKRMRPADMVPYRYDRAQPTTWLWVSEGITDYYADLALVRGGVVDSSEFLRMTMAKIDEVASAPAVALEDASLSTWIHPTDGSGYLYYPKGSLAGFLLDIYIRDASDNSAGLDAVMREVYQRSHAAGRGFTSQDWWGAVQRAAKGKSFTDFNARYIDGREPFPWGAALPLAGLKLKSDTLREPRLGVFTAMDSTSTAVIVTEVEPGGAADAAGVKRGDALISVGEIPVSEGFGTRFRARYGRAEGESIALTVRRGGKELTLTMVVRMSIQVQQRIIIDPAASPKARRVRRGILTGRVDGAPNP
ncbi:MAG: M61 family metallopeptidase [Gemmatimonadaceae bacterium]|nr:M61 family metallopeptidase [Gemmatimonadaceae bacterium]